MDFRTLICLLGCIACVVAWKPNLPPLRRPTNEVRLGTEELIQTLSGKTSFKYRYLDAYLDNAKVSSVRIFGVKTSGAVSITLHDSTGGQSDLRFTLGSDKSCSATYMSRPATRTAACDVELVEGKSTWFTVEAMMTYIAVYADGIQQPVIDFAPSDMPKGLSYNFQNYDSYSVYSEGDALWDTQGMTLDREAIVTKYRNPFVEWALTNVKGYLKTIMEQAWNCEEADTIRHNAYKSREVKKHNRFFQNYCRSNFQMHRESIKRLEAILLINGMDLPNKADYDAKYFFAHQYR